MDCAFPLNSLNLYQKDFYGFYLLFKAGLHFPIHNNKLQCSSFFCTTNKFWDFVVQKIFFGYVRNLELPLPLVRNRTHLARPLPSPTLGERIMWKTPMSVSQRFRNRCLCWSVGVSLSVCVGVCVVSFLIKLQAWCSATLWKRYFNTGLFLWVMQNFWEHIRWLILSVWLRLLLG